MFYIIKCKHCGQKTERKLDVKIACCWKCKMYKNRERARSYWLKKKTSR